jgi:hypothetical protein
VIFQALAEERLHLSAVLALGPYLTPGNAAELLTAAARRSKSEIQVWLAGRFPRPDLPAEIQPLRPELVPERVEASELARDPVETAEPGPECAETSGLVPERVDASPACRHRVEPLSGGRFGVTFTMGQRVYDKLRRLEALLGHKVRDFDETFGLGLDARIRAFEKRRFAATDRPRASRLSKNRARYIPAEVKRAVRERDGGRCTFASAEGRRCEARAHLEFDHIEPVARGGLATVGNLRLRCRAHNQYAAEQAFGAGFMEHKREGARRAAEEKRAAPPDRADDRDVVPWLLKLGFRIVDARRAAAHCESLPDEASLEDRVKDALRFLTPAHRLPKKPQEIAA